MIKGKRIGLALSGGGYRAAAFHLGTLKKLDEMNILEKVDVLSTISGGSITGAAYCLHKGDYASFHEYAKEAVMTKNIIGKVLRSGGFLRLVLFALIFGGLAIGLLFTSWAPLSIVVLAILFFLLVKYQFLIFPVSREVEKAYDDFFYQKRTLIQLNEKPLLAIGSSNLQTGRPFTFSRNKMADTTYSYYDDPILFKHEGFPVARAVMASSCVPFAFTPVSIRKDFFRNPEHFGKIDPKLVDGGVYDNQGIQKITQKNSSYECDIIICSDSGGGLSFTNSYQNTVSLLIRTVDVFMNRIKTMQMVDNIYQNVGEKNKPIAYYSLGWRLQNCIPGFINSMVKGLVLPQVIAAHGFKEEWIKDPSNHKAEIQQHLEQNTGYNLILARDLTDEEWKLAKGTSTNLTPLSKQRTDCLIRQAENLTELQVKLYCPSILSL
jgi:NTE family protein